MGDAGGFDIEQLSVNRFVIRTVGHAFVQSVEHGGPGVFIQGVEFFDLLQVVTQFGIPVFQMEIVAQFVA